MTDTLHEVFSKYSTNVGYIDQNIQDVNEPGALGDTLLHLASFLGDIDSIRILIGNQADIDCLGDLGYTPLHLAVLGNSLNAVNELLAAGAEKLISNDFGEFPWMSARILGFTQIAVLLQAGVEKADDSVETEEKIKERILDFIDLQKGNFE